MASRVEIAPLEWAYFVDANGKPRAGVGPTIQTLAGGAVTIYAAKTGATPYGGAFVTDAEGRLPGFIEQGTYKLQEPLDGIWQEVQVTSGESAVEKGNLSVNLKDHGAVDGQNIDAALVAAFAVAPSDEFELFIPRGSYTFSAFPSLDGARSVVIRGEGGLSAGSSCATTLTFTGADAATAISARSSFGVEFYDLELIRSGSGILIDYSSTGTKGSATGRGSDTAYGVLRGCRLDGNLTAKLVDLDNAIIISFYDVSFYEGLIGVSGRAAAATYSNAINFFGCVWHGCVTCHVQNTGQNWGFYGNTFEQLRTALGANAGAGAIANTTACLGLVVSGSYFGDSDGTGTWISIGNASDAVSIDGNTFSDCAAAIATGASVFGTKISGNRFDDCTVAIALGGNPLGTVILGNDFVDGGITAAATIRGLTIKGNHFQTGVQPLTMDGTSATAVDFSGNNVASAAGDIAYSAGGMPSASILQRQSGNQLYVTSIFGVAGPVSDASFPAAPPNNTMAFDTTNSQIYVRIGGVWKKTAALT